MAQPKRIYGIIGYPVKHSLSPAMHNAAFNELKRRGEIDYDAEYKLFEVKPQELEGFLNSLSERNISGLNVTIPHKVRAKEILENIFTHDKNVPLIQKDLYYVKISGAINTVNMVDEKYYNTDVDGFLESLKEDLNFETKNKKVLLLGCGGAGRAIIAGLSWWKQTGINKIYISDISVEALSSAKTYLFQHESLKDKLEFILEGQIKDRIKDVDLLVNASPVGMREGDKSVVDKGLLHEDLSVYDIVYNRETQLIKDAKSLNLKCIGGLRMLWRQGISSFEIWTGKKAPKEVMWQALSSQISTK